MKKLLLALILVLAWPTTALAAPSQITVFKVDDSRVSNHILHEAVDYAIALWSQPSYIELEEGTQRAIQVSEDESCLIACTVKTNKRITIHLHPFNTTYYGISYARAVLCHEMGHAIGLWYHSPDTDSCLYKSITPTAPVEVPNQADWDNLAQLYDT